MKDTPHPDPLPQGEGKVPETLAKARRWSEFLLAEVDDWYDEQIRKNQERFEASVAILVDDLREEPYRLSDEGVPLFSAIRKMRWLVRSRGEMLLALFERRARSLLDEKRKKEEEVFAQWEGWIETFRH